MKLIAVTGSIGAGKSTVVRGLAARGAITIDADETARRAVDPREPVGSRVLGDISALLGADALNDDGTLNRDAVAARIFADDALRAQYNAVIHPAIMQLTRDSFDAVRDHDVVVHEIPLLTADTAALPWTYDLIVTVEADAAERLRRLTQDRGYTAEHAAARIAAQADEERRTSIADVVLRTDIPREATEHLVDQLWRRVRGDLP